MDVHRLRLLASVIASIFLANQATLASSYTFTDLGVSSDGGALTFNTQGQINPTPGPPFGEMRPQDGLYSVLTKATSTAYGSDDGPIRAFASIFGSANSIEINPGTTNLEMTYGSAVNSNGTFVGSASNYSSSEGLTLGRAISFTFSGGTQVVATPNQGQAAAFSINDAGLIVGTSGNRAFLTEGKTSWDLNTLIPSNGQFLLTSATDINNTGQILGLATDLKDNTEHYFLLTPTATPEPSTLLFFGAGILLTGWRFRKGTARRIS